MTKIQFKSYPLKISNSEKSQIYKIPIFPLNWESWERRNKDEIPVLNCFLCNNGSGIKVWCKYCRDFHHHGNGNHLGKKLKIGEVTHREGHCCKCSESPYIGTGYFLKLMEMEK